jgi:WD40 repeat protein
VKIWRIPDGGLTEPIKEATQTLSGHGKPVSLLQWNPVASNVLASVGKDPSVKIWDVESGVAKVTLEGFGGLVQDFAWNNTGW